MINYKLKEQGIDIVDTVLTNRGLTAEDVEVLLNPSKDSEESPLTFKNMSKAITKVIKAIAEGKLIVIPIDSDCDGWCSAGQLYHYIRYVLGYENVIYIFHDNAKAHGFTDYIVKKLKTLKAGLVIMADGGCGDDDRKKYQTVIDNGADIVILDHHPFEGVYQDEVALVNCHQKHENTNTCLSGASVVYKFLQALSNKIGNPKEVERYRDLVALSLVSDLMDLKQEENRFLLNQGTEEVNIVNPFIKKLMEKKKIEEFVTIEELGFSVAPLINATVRMGKKADKEKVFRSVMGVVENIESEKRGEKGKGIFVPLEDEAYRIATNLKSAQDKKRDKGMEQLLSEVGEDGLLDGNVFIADVTESIDAEISGLVANKMLDIVNKPILLLRRGKGGNGFSGSSRGLSESEDLPSFKKLVESVKMASFCSGHDNAFGTGIEIDSNEVLKVKKMVKKQVESETEEGEEVDKKEINTRVENMLMNLSDNKLDELKKALNDSLRGVEFFQGYSVDGVYEGAVPLAHVKAIAEYEKLWCNNIKAPLFVVKNVRMNTEDIEKVGNATYKFDIGSVRFTKNYGSKVWYQSVIQSEELPFGGDIIADIVCKFRKNKKGFYWCDIVDMVTREDDEEAVDF